MRAQAAIVAILLAVSGSPAQRNDPFTGKWRWSHGKESLLLLLRQSGARITGRHTAVGEQGLRVDEVLDNQPPSIEGTVEGETANVTFRSGFPDGHGQGKATLALRGGALYWRKLETSGEEYFPREAKLSRTR